jgi:hypothetical protein
LPQSLYVFNRWRNAEGTSWPVVLKLSQDFRLCFLTAFKSYIQPHELPDQTVRLVPEAGWPVSFGTSRT